MNGERLGDGDGLAGDGDVSRDRRFATTLARGLSVLRAFRPEDDGLGNAEIAARTRLPKSTVSRLSFTLRALGYLAHARGDERYHPGPALLALGNVAAEAVPFVELAAPSMQRLADDTGTLAVLAVRDDRKLLLARTWRPRGVASLWLEVGHRVPIARSSSGHALLAALSGDGFARLLGDAATEDGLGAGRAERIRRSALAELGRSGFVAADPGDYFTPNIHAVSVPFRASRLDEPVVFTCGATPSDLTLARLYEEVGPKLRAAVDELARVTAGTADASVANTAADVRVDAIAVATAAGLRRVDVETGSARTGEAASGRASAHGTRTGEERAIDTGHSPDHDHERGTSP